MNKILPFLFAFQFSVKFTIRKKFCIKFESSIAFVFLFPFCLLLLVSTLSPAVVPRTRPAAHSDHFMCPFSHPIELPGVLHSLSVNLAQASAPLMGLPTQILTSLTAVLSVSQLQLNSGHMANPSPSFPGLEVGSHTPQVTKASTTLFGAEILV